MLDTITKQNQVILELLASLKAEQKALTLMLMRHLIDQHNCDSHAISDNYVNDAKDELENLKIQIKSKFGLDKSIDDLLNSALK